MWLKVQLNMFPDDGKMGGKTGGRIESEALALGCPGGNNHAKHAGSGPFLAILNVPRCRLPSSCINHAFEHRYGQK